MDWRITLHTSNEQLNGRPDGATGAEQRFKDAFERLKLGVPQVLPKGTPVSQNNVAKEAGCDTSALRKTRFPLLVLAIQEWTKSHKGESAPSKRQQRRRNRQTNETMADFKKQRDAAVGLLVDADLRIVQLTEKLALVEAKLEEFQRSATILAL